MLSRVLLSDGAVSVAVSPEHGCLTGLDVRVGDELVNILRPAREDSPHHIWALGASSFVMLPYCGRLRGGTFCFRGQIHRFPLNALPERHSSHGDAWMRRWTLTEHDRRMARLVLEDDDSAPLRYQCTQAISIRGNRVDLDLAIRNDSGQPIPMGVGIHPYFANRASAVLKAELPSRWELDAELMPVKLVDNDFATGLRRGQRVAELPAVLEGAGWDGKVTIEWRTPVARVRLESAPSLRHAVLWVPQGEDFFCFEPTSHATDALNHSQGHTSSSEDFIILEPGALREQRFTFVVDAPRLHDLQHA